MELSRCITVVDARGGLVWGDGEVGLAGFGRASGNWRRSRAVGGSGRGGLEATGGNGRGGDRRPQEPGGAVGTKRGHGDGQTGRDLGISRPVLTRVLFENMGLGPLVELCGEDYSERMG